MKSKSFTPPVLRIIILHMFFAKHQPVMICEEAQLKSFVMKEFNTPTDLFSLNDRLQIYSTGRMEKKQIITHLLITG